MIGYYSKMYTMNGISMFSSYFNDGLCNTNRLIVKTLSKRSTNVALKKRMIKRSLTLNSNLNDFLKIYKSKCEFKSWAFCLFKSITQINTLWTLSQGIHVKGRHITRQLVFLTQLILCYSRNCLFAMGRFLHFLLHLRNVANI